MASVLNRTTKQYLTSVNTPDYPTQDWIIDPDLSAVTSFASIYWIITGDVVTLMDQAQRDAVDATILEAQRDSTVNELDATEGILRAFASVVVDEINILRQQHALGDRTLAQLKTAMRAKLGS